MYGKILIGIIITALIIHFIGVENCMNLARQVSNSTNMPWNQYRHCLP